MTVKQALKLKNKLVQELNELQVRLQANNSVIEGNVRNYSSKETLSEIYIKVDELNFIKTKIHRTNSPVYDKIFLLAELKSLVSNLKSLDCTSGIAEDYYSRRLDTPTIKNSEISVVERDSEIKFLENRIEELQEELDTFNSTTVVEE
jgi:hypothetical protein